MTQQQQSRLKGGGSGRWILLVVACVGAGWALLVLAPSPAQKAFAWFGRLGFPDVRGHKYVKVATGGWSQAAGREPENSYIEGFLLSESNGTFTIFAKDLSVQTFQKTPGDTPAYKTVGFEVLDLKSNAVARLNTTNLFLYGIQVFMGRQISEDFFLGWGCERNGLHGLAEDLYRKAVGTRNPPLRLKVRSWQDIRNYAELLIERWKKPPFIHDLEDEIGEMMMWRAVLAFQDPQTSRAELLQKFQEIVEKYPHCKHVSEAKESISILRQMVREDEMHGRKGIRAPADISKEEKIAELIFQLREQNGHQWSNPGSCDIFEDPRGTNSPADQLVAVGYDAVPALLAAVESKEFSRSVGWGRSFYYSHYVLSVGDCAFDILERIAARDFRRAGYAKSTSSKEQAVVARKAAAEAWWEEFKQKGEKVMLIEGAERGDDDSAAQAALLIKRYPKEAVSVVPQGAQQATNSWVRSRLIELTDFVPFLKEEVVHGPTLESRLAAAKQLHLQRLADGVDAMIEEWNKAHPNSFEEETWSPGSLAEFLANSGKLRAIEALRKDLNARPVPQRWAVIEATAREGSERSLPSAGGSPIRPRQFHDPPEELDHAAEQLLTEELEDTERYMGMSGGWDDKSFSNPRMCDIAAHVLWKRWPQKYFFDLNASEKRRERERIVCLNTWRVQNRLPALPLPESKILAEIDPGKVAALLSSVRTAKSRGEVHGAILALESLGPAAIPEIHKAIANSAQPNAQRGELESLEKRLACFVTEIICTNDPGTPNIGLEPLVASLTNSPLTAEKFISLPLHVAQGWRNHTAGIVLSAARDDDLMGVRMEIALTTNRAAQAGTQKGWSSWEQVTLGKENVHNSGGGSSVEYGATKECYKDLAQAIDKALNASPQIPFEISLTLLREK